MIPVFVTFVRIPIGLISYSVAGICYLYDLYDDLSLLFLQVVFSVLRECFITCLNNYIFKQFIINFQIFVSNSY